MTKKRNKNGTFTFAKPIKKLFPISATAKQGGGAKARFDRAFFKFSTLLTINRAFAPLPCLRRSFAQAGVH